MATRRGRSPGRPTVDAVAARAGVGRGTVSRVINGSPQVSARTRAAVEQAIAELGYVPNRAARTLVTRRTDAVALVVAETPERSFPESFFTDLVRGVSAELQQTRMQLWLALTRSPGERERVEQHLTSLHVDGVLLLSLHDDDPLPALLRQRGLPTVLGGRPTATPSAGTGPTYYVDIDHAGGARQAVDHLFTLGRRRIAAIAGPPGLGAGAARLAGYREAVAAGGGAGTDDLIAYGDLTMDGSAEAMRTLLARVPDLDAVFVASDLMACGALRALRESGRRVPEDVAVVGFEDSSVAWQTDPPLTTVQQPVTQMGGQMVRLLMALIRGHSPQPPHMLLDTCLVIRASA